MEFSGTLFSDWGLGWGEVLVWSAAALAGAAALYVLAGALDALFDNDA